MGQRAGHAVTRAAVFTAAPAPSVLLDDPARQYPTVGGDLLAGHLQPEFVETAESGQVSASSSRDSA